MILKELSYYLSLYIKYNSFTFNPNISKQYYLSIRFYEVNIEISPKQIYFQNDLKYLRK